jgi:hypothetical protein
MLSFKIRILSLKLNVAWGLNILLDFFVNPGEEFF